MIMRLILWLSVLWIAPLVVGRAGQRRKIQEKSGRRRDDPTGISGRSGHCRASCPFPAAGVDALRHPRGSRHPVYLCAGLWAEHDALVGLAAARLRPALCALCAVQSGAQAPEGRARLAQRDCAVHRNRRSFCDPILPMALGVAVCAAASRSASCRCFGARRTGSCC